MGDAGCSDPRDRPAVLWVDPSAAHCDGDPWLRGFAVTSCRDLTQGRRELRRVGAFFHALVCERRFRDGHGMTLIAEARDVVAVRILFAERFSEEDFLASFRDGVTLLLRSEAGIQAVRSAILAARSLADDGGAIRKTKAWIDLQRGELRGPAALVSLTGSQLKLLRYLSKCAGLWSSAPALSLGVFGRKDSAAHHLVAQHVGNLRRAFRVAGVPALIETRRGFGYRMRAEHPFVFDQGPDAYSSHTNAADDTRLADFAEARIAVDPPTRSSP